MISLKNRSPGGIHLLTFKRGTHHYRVALLLGLFSFSVLSAQASESARLTGRVVDRHTRIYMENVEVSIVGTGLAVLTDSYGYFRLGDLPDGTYSVELKHAGYAQRQLQATLQSGQTTDLETIQLRSVTTWEEQDEVHELEPFPVRPETDAYSIALQKQRMSDMNKVVMNSGAFGEVTEGNVGEFIKFLPSISVNYVAADIRSIDVRGLGANFTSITVDGNRMASAASTEPDRVFELEQVSLNNVEQVEVIRVPTADVSADALGGTVNLVSRSAFERDGRYFSYRAYLNMNDEALTFFKSPGWGPRNQRKVWPGFDFNFSDVVADGRLGISLNYLNSNQFNPQYRSRFRWEFDELVDLLKNNKPPPDGSDPVPILQSYQITDGPKHTRRESFSLRLDYRAANDLVLTANFQWNDYRSEFRNRTSEWNTQIYRRTDNTQPPAVVSETEVWSRFSKPTSFQGGLLNQSSAWADKFGTTKHGDISFVKTLDNWVLDGGAFYSIATNRYRALDHGFLNAVFVTNFAPGYLVLSDFGDARGNYQDDPPKIEFRDADGSLDVPDLGFGDAGNLALLDIRDRPQDGEDEFSGAYANAKWNFDLNGNRAFLNFGARFQRQDRFGDQQTHRSYFLGADGLGIPNLEAFANFDDQFLSVLEPDPVDPVYQGQDAYFIGGNDGVNLQWPNNEAMTGLFLAHPDQFVEGSFASGNIISEANDIFTIQEDITAAYLMGKLFFFQDRMSLTAGLRFEETAVTANGALFNEAAGYLQDSAGNPLLDVDDVDGDGKTNEFIPVVRDPKRPENPDSVETLRLQWLSDRQTNRASYNDIYPSLGMKIDLTDQLMLRLAYAKTIGRPNFADIIPRTEIEYDPSFGGESSGLTGSVIINNTALQPYESDNWDLSLEYYPESGGQLMVGLFRKDITNWIIDVDSVVSEDLITSKGLPDNTLGFPYFSTGNAGSAKVEGLELSLYRPLNMAFLPDWFRHFSLLANATFLRTSGDFGNIGLSEPITELEDMAERTVNLGLTYEDKRFKLQLRYNRRGRELETRVLSEYYNVYNLPLEQVDLNLEYRITPRLGIFVSGRNVTKSRHRQIWKSHDFSATPELEWEVLHYSRYFGVQWVVGIKGQL